MATLEETGRIDFELEEEQADSRCLTQYLFGPARGKMFGVLVAESSSGARVVLKAFSGQYNGQWQVPGWVGPLFDLDAFCLLHDREEAKIKGLGAKIAASRPGTTDRKRLIAERKGLSRKLMQALHAVYRVRNFSGREAGLKDIFPPGTGIPTGTGDCCAPKLLQHAVVHGLRPLGMAEFYWGRANSSATRLHGQRYPSCRAKCYPLLGFMLCGLDREGRHGWI